MTRDLQASNCKTLAKVIVWMACKDYMRVKRGLMDNPRSYWLRKEMAEIMAFFESDEFVIYSLGGNYQFYIRLCNELIAEGKSLPTNAFVKKKGGKNNGKCE